MNCLPWSLPSEIDDLLCVTAPTDQRSPPKCLTILDPGAKPDNLIVGRKSRSGIAAVSRPGHAECLPGGRIARKIRSMSPVETRRQRPGFSAGAGAERQVGRDVPSPKTSLRRDAVGTLGISSRWGTPASAVGRRSNLGRAAGELDCPGEARDPTSTVAQSRAEREDPMGRAAERWQLRRGI